MVFRLDIGQKFVRSDFDEPGWFSSLNLGGEMACVKDRLAKCEMRMEKVSAHDLE